MVSRNSGTDHSRRSAIILLCFLCVNPALVPLGTNKNEAEVPREPDSDGIREYQAVVIGVIRLVGNEPFTELVITEADGTDFVISETSEARRIMHDMQGMHVKVEGRVEESDVFAGKDRYLGKIRIIFPEIYPGSS